jgi:hypothetical protein
MDLPMRVREARGAGGLALLIVAALGGCGETVPEDLPPGDGDPREVRALLDSLSGRNDPESLRMKARACVQLRRLGAPDAPELLLRGDQADFELMGMPAPADFKKEAARRLAANFRERAGVPALVQTEFPGTLGPPLRRVVLQVLAASFAEYGAPGELPEAVQQLAEALEALARSPSLTEEAKEHFRAGARTNRERLEALRISPPESVSPELRRFCELPVQGHLDEAVRQADNGIRDKADRSKSVQVVNWYMRSLMHLVAVRETRSMLRPSEATALSRVDVVVRGLCDLLCAP